MGWPHYSALFVGPCRFTHSPAASQPAAWSRTWTHPRWHDADRHRMTLIRRTPPFICYQQGLGSPKICPAEEVRLPAACGTDGLAEDDNDNAVCSPLIPPVSANQLGEAWEQFGYTAREQISDLTTGSLGLTLSMTCSCLRPMISDVHQILLFARALGFDSCKARRLRPTMRPARLSMPNAVCPEAAVTSTAYSSLLPMQWKQISGETIITRVVSISSPHNHCFDYL